MKSKRYLKIYVRGLFHQTKTAFERDEILRTAALALLALAVAYLTAVGVSLKLPHFGDVWEWVLGLWIILLFIFVAPYRLWLDVTKKVEAFEDAARPKLTVSRPIETFEPKGATGSDVTSREWRLRVSNISTTLIKNCYVKMTSLVNVDGHESDVLGMHFKLSIDQPFIIQSYEHRQSFDLPAGSDEIVSICGTNATVDKDQQVVIMLYAIHGVGGQGIRNAIPRRFFPHTLKIHVCADNITEPLERTYRLFFDDAGVFKMEHAHERHPA